MNPVNRAELVAVAALLDADAATYRRMGERQGSAWGSPYFQDHCIEQAQQHEAAAARLRRIAAGDVQPVVVVPAVAQSLPMGSPLRMGPDL